MNGLVLKIVLVKYHVMKIHVHVAIELPEKLHVSDRDLENVVDIWYRKRRFV